MSEEEAIKILKEITPDDLLNCWEGGEKEFNAIETILDLYQKEKEKNNYEWMRRNCLPTDLVKKLYISKDKIRAFIEENLPDDEICSCCDNYDSNGVAIKINLENLLKE